MSFVIPKEINKFLKDNDEDSNIVISPLSEGGNNRAYKIKTTKSSYLLKHYYLDERNRGETDFSFSKFLWDSGNKNIPKPYLITDDQQYGLYEFCFGRKLKANEIDKKHIALALNFLLEINKHKELALNIKNASEACFSVSEHEKLIQSRVSRLIEIEVNSDIDKEAYNFINSELNPYSNKVIKNLSKSKYYNTTSKKILSPSDFGFHNCLLKEDNSLCFFDFEYAGYDSATKLICDFFCQPEIPAPLEFMDEFTANIEKEIAKDEYLKEQVKLLFPLYQIKWCCIMLNEFTKSDAARKEFSSETDFELKKKNQLAKAKVAFSKLEAL